MTNIDSYSQLQPLRRSADRRRHLWLQRQHNARTVRSLARVGRLLCLQPQPQRRSEHTSGPGGVGTGCDCSGEERLRVEVLIAAIFVYTVLQSAHRRRHCCEASVFRVPQRRQVLWGRDPVHVGIGAYDCAGARRESHFGMTVHFMASASQLLYRWSGERILPARSMVWLEEP